MASILSVAELKAYRQFSNVRADQRLQECIDDAERIDVKHLLGEVLYYDLKANPTETARGNYPLLLAGGDYEDSGYTQDFVGLKRVIIDYATARFRFLENETDTAFGFRAKDYEGSSAPTPGRIAQVYAHFQKSAHANWCECKLFLDRNIDTFDYWFGAESKLDNSEDPIIINRVTIN